MSSVGDPVWGVVLVVGVSFQGGNKSYQNEGEPQE